MSSELVTWHQWIPAAAYVSTQEVIRIQHQWAVSSDSRWLVLFIYCWVSLLQWNALLTYCLARATFLVPFCVYVLWSASYFFCVSCCCKVSGFMPYNTSDWAFWMSSDAVSCSFPNHTRVTRTYFTTAIRISMKLDCGWRLSLKECTSPLPEWLRKYSFCSQMWLCVAYFLTVLTRVSSNIAFAIDPCFNDDFDHPLSLNVDEVTECTLSCIIKTLKLI